MCTCVWMGRELFSQESNAIFGSDCYAYAAADYMYIADLLFFRTIAPEILYIVCFLNPDSGLRKKSWEGGEEKRWSN